MISKLSDKPFAFMDFEASSLLPGGYPIEVAWVLPSGQGESYLVKPASYWTEWSASSEKIHGIPYSELSTGSSCILVAKRILAVSKKYQFAVSAPEWDGMWLDMLLQAGGVQEKVPVISDDLVYFNACSPMMELMTGKFGTPEFYRSQREIADAMQDLIGQVEEQEELKGKPAHRALADAQAMWLMWKTISDKAQGYVDLKRNPSM